jgi:hypothetical protein
VFATIAYRFTGRRIFHIQVHAKLPESRARIVFRPFGKSVLSAQLVEPAPIVQKKQPVKCQLQSKPKQLKTVLQKSEKPLIKKKQSLSPKSITQKSTQKKDPIIKKQSKKGIEEKKRYINQKDLETLQVQTNIQQLIYKRWKPPIGLSKDLVCTISVMVDKRGVVTSAIVIKPSGVLMYDISARSALTRLTIPQVAQNQSFSITFKQ